MATGASTDDVAEDGKEKIKTGCQMAHFPLDGCDRHELLDELLLEAQNNIRILECTVLDSLIHTIYVMASSNLCNITPPLCVVSHL